jgi:hypothetical protein
MSGVSSTTGTVPLRAAALLRRPIVVSGRAIFRWHVLKTSFVHLTTNNRLPPVRTYRYNRPSRRRLFNGCSKCHDYAGSDLPVAGAPFAPCGAAGRAAAPLDDDDDVDNDH